MPEEDSSHLPGYNSSPPYLPETGFFPRLLSIRKALPLSFCRFRIFYCLFRQPPPYTKHSHDAAAPDIPPSDRYIYKPFRSGQIKVTESQAQSFPISDVYRKVRFPNTCFSFSAFLSPIRQAYPEACQSPRLLSLHKTPCSQWKNPWFFPPAILP